MAINPEEIDLVTTGQLQTLPFNINNFIAHTALSGTLGKGQLSSLATFLAPYIATAGATSFVPVTGTSLPTPVGSGSFFTFVGAQTSTQANGTPVVTTELLNVLVYTSGAWSLLKAIDLTTYLNNNIYYKSIEIIPNSSVNRSGTIVSDAIIDRTGYLPVKQGDVLTITTGIWQSIVTSNDKVVYGFDSNKAPVQVLVDPRVVGGGVDGTPLLITNYKLIIPSGISFVIIPIHQTYRNVFKVAYNPVVTLIPTQSVKRDGTFQNPDALFNRTDYISVNPLDTVTVTTSLWQSLVVANDKVMVGYDSNKAFVKILADPRVIGGGTDNSPLKIFNYSVKLPSNVAYVTIPVDNTFVSSFSFSTNAIEKVTPINEAVKANQTKLEVLTATANTNVSKVNYDALFDSGVNVIAHAGGVHLNSPSIAPINSILAAENASRIGHKFVEFDCVFTKDEIPVVCHDLFLNDYFVNMDGTQLSGTKNVVDYTLDELRTQFKEKNSTTDNVILIATVRDFINESLVGGWAPVIEVKGTNQLTTARAKVLVDMVKPLSKVMFIAFDTNALSALRTYSKSIPLGYLTSATVTQSVADLCLSYDAIADVAVDVLTDDAFALLTKSGVKVGVWTPETIQSYSFIKRGVSIITSDYLPPLQSSVYKNRTVLQSGINYSAFTTNGTVNSPFILTLSGTQSLIASNVPIYAFGYYRLRIQYKGSISVSVNGKGITANSIVWDSVYFSEVIGANTTMSVTVTGNCKIRLVKLEVIEA